MDANHSVLPLRLGGKRALIGVLGVLAVGTGAGYAAGRARAPGVPTTVPMTYSATLTDAAGVPLVGPKNIQLQIWDAPTGGTSQCGLQPVSLPLVAGTFQLTLPPECTTAVHAHPDLWSEIFVDGASLGRTKLGAVPYALEADSAERAKAATGALDTRIGALEQLVNGLPSRLGVIARSATRTGAIPPSTSAWTEIPGLGVSFTLTETSLVQLTANGVQRTIDQNATTICHSGYRYVVDGTPQGSDGWGLKIHVTTGATARHSTWTMADNYTLGPGTHTIAVHAKNPTPEGACYICGEFNGALEPYDSCQLNVLAVPK
jgi:hypothetical protein